MINSLKLVLVYNNDVGISLICPLFLYSHPTRPTGSPICIRVSKLELVPCSLVKIGGIFMVCKHLPNQDGKPVISLSMRCLYMPGCLPV